MAVKKRAPRQGMKLDRFALRLPPDVNAALGNLATQEGVSVNTVIVRILARSRVLAPYLAAARALHPQKE